MDHSMESMERCSKEGRFVYPSTMRMTPGPRHGASTPARRFRCGDTTAEPREKVSPHRKTKKPIGYRPTERSRRIACSVSAPQSSPEASGCKNGPNQDP